MANCHRWSHPSRPSQLPGFRGAFRPSTTTTTRMMIWTRFAITGASFRRPRMPNLSTARKTWRRGKARSGHTREIALIARVGGCRSPVHACRRFSSFLAVTIVTERVWAKTAGTYQSKTFDDRITVSRESSLSLRHHRKTIRKPHWLRTRIRNSPYGVRYRAIVRVYWMQRVRVGMYVYMGVLVASASFRSGVLVYFTESRKIRWKEPSMSSVTRSIIAKKKIIPTGIIPTGKKVGIDNKGGALHYHLKIIT